jgi:hypothetical protein
MAIFYLIALILLANSPAFAEIKIILSEDTYIMGDGETLTFAEAMALQKAKLATAHHGEEIVTGFLIELAEAKPQELERKGTAGGTGNRSLSGGTCGLSSHRGLGISQLEGSKKC